MAVTYKDIGQLTQKSSVAGTEKIPVSDTQYITPSQIAGMIPVDTALSGTSTNPVQNKKVKEEFDKVVYLGTAMGSTEGDAATPLVGVSMNGANVTVTDGIAILGTVLTSHQDISGKQDVIDATHKLDYSLLSNTPTIPSTTGLASETYVDNAIASALGDVETLLAAI